MLHGLDETYTEVDLTRLEASNVDCLHVVG